jgi:hypothetical protein
MGRNAQRRRQRRERSRVPSPSSPPTKLAVGTYPDSGGHNVSVRRDVELVKAALLYADEIELISPGAAMLGSVVGMAAAGADGLIEMMLTFDDETVGRCPPAVRLGVVVRNDHRRPCSGLHGNDRGPIDKPRRTNPVRRPGRRPGPIARCGGRGQSECAESDSRGASSGRQRFGGTPTCDLGSTDGRTSRPARRSQGSTRPV